MTVCYALEDVVDVGLGLDAVEFCSLDEGADHGPAGAAAVAAGEEMVLAAERHGPDGALDGVGVEFHPTIFQGPCHVNRGWSTRFRGPKTLGCGARAFPNVERFGSILLESGPVDDVALKVECVVGG